MNQLRKAYQLAKAFWASLPHQVQALAVLFGTAAGTTLGKELQALWFGTGSFTWITLRHDIGMAVTAGIIAVRCFYMLPSISSTADVAVAPAPTPAAK
jgi:hypothetical protein